MLVWVCRADPPYNDWDPTLFPIPLFPIPCGLTPAVGGLPRPKLERKHKPRLRLDFTLAAHARICRA